MSGADLAKAMAPAEKPACDDEGGMNRALCLAHCTADDQSLDTGSQLVLAPPCLPILVVSPSQPPKHSLFPTVRVARTSDPPIPIRFCSLLI